MRPPHGLDFLFKTDMKASSSSRASTSPHTTHVYTLGKRLNLNRVRFALPNEHERLQEDMTAQEVVASEQNAFISDLADIDRTSELVLWMIQNMWPSSWPSSREKLQEVEAPFKELKTEPSDSFL